MAKKRDVVIEEHIEDIDVSEEMRKSFLEYSYSVIYARALPDARDGLKPVQRRILFQMYRMGLRPDKGHVKSSRVVGDVMGRLHPHGDTAIYDAMVRLAQPFTMRLPLVDGHGNFGSLDDGPAAPRYTEVRMAPAALAMTDSLDEEVVNMVANYDNTLLQPEVLPAAIPNLLVNGASGIAVGMATNMPSHNLREVIAGARHLLMHPEADLDELMRYIPGPDLPEGGKIVGLEGIRNAYASGQGIFRTRATAHIENISARKKGIVVTELPYLTGAEKVIEKIKSGIQSKKLKGISAVQNHTDRHHGMRLVIEVKNSFNPEAVLSALYKHTPLEESFGINNVALVDGQPRLLGLKDLLNVYIDHRLQVTRRRSQFRLNKALEQLHLIEGLLIALMDIDEVIQVIRSSEDSERARQRLMDIFDLSQRQAEYILELRLRRLTKFSQLELEKQQADLQERIAYLQKILASEVELKKLVAAEMQEIADIYGTPRRTLLLEADSVADTSNNAKMQLKVADDPCWVLYSSTGRIARVVSENPPSRSGPRAPHDALRMAVATSNLAEIGVVTSQGNMIRLSVVDIPAIPETDSAPSLVGGALLEELLLLGKDERPVAICSLEKSAPPLALATWSGKIKRLIADYPLKSNFEIISLQEGDEVIATFPAGDSSEIVLITSQAQLLHFPATTVRPQGRSGQGISGIKLPDTASVITGAAVENEEFSAYAVVTISGAAAALPGTTPGRAKVTPLSAFPEKGRATQGVRAQRFLKGEDILTRAWVGPLPARAVDANGKAVSLPEIEEKRDASGTPLKQVVYAIG